MASNHTENYGLNQWERSDKVQMEDFNADNAKIDAALKAEVDARTAAVAAQATALKEETEARTTAITLCAQFLASEVQERTALSSVVEKRGNCQIYYGTYTGTGIYGETTPQTLTFDDLPMLILIVDVNGRYTLLFKDNYNGSSYNGGSYSPRAIWSGNTVSWYGQNADAQMNVSGFAYRWIALCSKS